MSKEGPFTDCVSAYCSEYTFELQYCLQDDAEPRNPKVFWLNGSLARQLWRLLTYTPINDEQIDALWVARPHTNVIAVVQTHPPFFYLRICLQINEEPFGIYHDRSQLLTILGFIGSWKVTKIRLNMRTTLCILCNISPNLMPTWISLLLPFNDDDDINRGYSHH